MSKLNIAVIGCGGISGSHLPNIVANPDMRLVALMDVREEAARKRRQEFGGDYVATDVRQVLDDRNVDAVLISASHNTHVDLLCQAAAAGKHAFVEKPLGLTIAECRRAQKAVADSGIKCQAGFWFRHHPITEKVKELVGPPYLFLGRCAKGGGAGFDPRATLEGRGPLDRSGLLDQAGYNLDLMYHLMESQPTLVTAESVGSGVSSTAVINVKFANGAVGCSLYSEVGVGGLLGKWYYEVFGGKTSAAIDGYTKVLFGGASKEAHEFPYQEGFHRQMKLFSDCVLKDLPSPLDVWEASVATILTEKAIQAARTGTAVPVNLADEMLPRPWG